MYNLNPTVKPSPPSGMCLPLNAGVGAALGLAAAGVLAQHHPRLCAAVPEAAVFGSLLASGVLANLAALEASDRGIPIVACLLAEAAVLGGVMTASHFALKSPDQEFMPAAHAIGSGALAIAAVSVAMGYYSKM